MDVTALFAAFSVVEAAKNRFERCKDVYGEALWECAEQDDAIDIASDNLNRTFRELVDEANDYRNEARWGYDYD